MGPQPLKKEVLPDHFQVLEQIYENLRWLFLLPQRMPKKSPLWQNLLKEGGSVRKISFEWNQSAQYFFKKFSSIDLGEEFLLVGPKNIRNFFDFGFYGKCLQLLKKCEDAGLESIDYELLKVKIFCLPDTHDQIATFLTKKLNFQRLNICKLILDLLIQKKRMQKIFTDVDSDLEFAVLDNRNGILNLAKNPIEKIKLINALNYLQLEHKGSDFAIKSIESQVFPLTEIIKCSRLRNHIKGNAYYQMAVIFRYENEIENEERCLKHSLGYEALFFDALFRLASIFHDRGDERSGNLYRQALLFSSFDEGLCNDYGCFVSEFETSEKIESWGIIYDFFFKK